MQSSNNTSFLQYIDFFSVPICWLLAYFFRFHVLMDGQEGLVLTFLRQGVLLWIIQVYFMHSFGLYEETHLFRPFKTLSILKVTSAALTCFIILLYFIFPYKLSRIVLLNYFILINLFFFLARFIWPKNKALKNVLFIGNDPSLKEMAKKYARDSRITYKIITPNFKALPQNIDLIILTMEEFQASPKLFNIFHRILTPIYLIPPKNYPLYGLKMSYWDQTPFFTLNRAKLSSWDKFLKRTLDIFLSFLGLLILSPFLFVLGVLVKMTSKGPIFYGQERMGLNGEIFKMWKFRSMKNDADLSGTGWTTENDPRRTSFGTFIRSTSLDELPQLFNVLKGDMSLVGPRPERPYFVDKFKHEIPNYMLRHKVKAGITGWAQVHGLRGNTPLDKRIEYDIYYIENWSFLMDIKILLATFWSGLIHRNAY